VSLCRGATSVVHPSTFHILNFFLRMAEGIYSKLATHVPYEVLTKCCYFLNQSKIQYGHLGIWLADTFWNFSRTAEGIYSKLATNVPDKGPDQVLLLFKPIRNPIWPPWPLIGWHILNFFSRTSEGIYSKFATNVPYEILTMCCYYLNRSKSLVAAIASDWLTYKKLIISFCFKFLSGIYK